MPTNYRDSKIIFATDHGKALAAREAFREILNCSIEELKINSDRLGTFSGEVAREGSMLDALRGKIHFARQLTNERYVMASEGSFSAEAGLGFITHATELMMIHDSLTAAEVVEQYLTWDTNYSTALISNSAELHGFLTSIKFDSHALVLYPEGISPAQVCFKGLTALTQAEKAFDECLELSPAKRVVAMSDMRAHLNPTRMSAIKQCSKLLAQRLATTCPKCRSGGFGIVETVAGLPCEECGAPTHRASGEWHACVICGKRLLKPRSDGLTKASSAECELCNP